MTFRQFAIRWVNDNVSKVKGRGILFDLAELLDNYSASWQTMEIVLNNFQKLVAAWKEYQEK